MQGKSNSEGFRKIDTTQYERWFHRIISHWHLFVISLGLAYAGTYYYLKYTTSIYSASASLLVKDATQNINPFENKGFADYGYGKTYNLINEIKVLTSRRLIEQTVRALNWKYNVFIEGKIKATLLYGEEPFMIQQLDSTITIANARIYFNALPNNEFVLSFKENKEKYALKSKYSTDEEINVNGTRFKITKKNPAAEWDNQQYSFVFINQNQIVSEYVSKLKVYQLDKNSSVISIISQGPNVEKEKAFINQHSNMFIKNSLNEKNATNERAIIFIETQLEDIADTLNYIESEMTYFRKRFSGSNMELLAEKRFLKLELLEDEKSKYELGNRYFEYLKKYLTSKTDYTDLVVPSSIGLSDPVLTKLLQELIELKMKQNTMFKTEQSLSPFRIDNENKINQIKNNIFEAIKNIENTNQILLTDIDTRIKKLGGNTTNILDNERHYAELKRKYKINEELYNLLLKKKAEMGITRAGLVADTKIVDFANFSGIVYPIPKKLFMTNLFFALLIPLFYVLFKYITNYRIMDKEDITSICAMPLLGTIGRIPDKDNMVIINKPRSSLAESFRSIRANLSFFMPDQNQKVIMITSSVSGDGKTFASLNIASIIATSGKKIVLIGADMRKPKVYLDIDTKTNNVGLSNYLSNRAGINEIIRDTKYENLYFISSGPVPPNPAELLMSSKLEELIKNLKANYDYIIFDTPPIGLVSDAMSITPFADVNVYVVRHNYTQTKYIKELAEYIDSNKIKNLTYVFNDFDESKNYGYGYRYGYSEKRKKKGGGYYEEEIDTESFYKKYLKRFL